MIETAKILVDRTPRSSSKRGRLRPSTFVAAVQPEAVVEMGQIALLMALPPSRHRDHDREIRDVAGGVVFLWSMRPLSHHTMASDPRARSSATLAAGEAAGATDADLDRGATEVGLQRQPLIEGEGGAADQRLTV